MSDDHENFDFEYEFENNENFFEAKIFLPNGDTPEEQTLCVMELVTSHARYTKNVEWAAFNKIAEEARAFVIAFGKDFIT